MYRMEGTKGREEKRVDRWMGRLTPILLIPYLRQQEAVVET